MNNATDKIPKIQKDVKDIISKQLGIDVSDISNEDSLVSDLRMGPIELSDLSALLEKAGFNIEGLDFANIDTVSDIFDYISEKEDL